MTGLERLAAAGLWMLPAILVVLTLYLGAPPAEPAPAAMLATGEQAYQASCAGCHTIGEGILSGPDLAGIEARRSREFLVRYIAEPDVMLAEGHPIALQLAAEWPLPMPNLGLSRAQAERILDYIIHAGAALAAPGEPPVNVTETPVTALAGDAGHGADLFTGRIRLTKGGAACAACHTAAGAGPFGGGTLGPDLSDLHARLGAPGVSGVLGALTAFPLKAEIYRDKPLSEQEKADLLAFFQESAAATEPAPPTWLYPLAGVAGTALLLLFTLPLALRGGPGVRRRLVERFRLRGAPK